MSKSFTYEEYLEKNGTLTYSNVGTSMMPMLKQGRDLFTVTKKGKERCRVGDVVLYKTSADKYVLHRIIEVREDDYVIMGDNCLNKEFGISDSDIIGILTEFVHDGKTYTADDRRYRRYTWLILHTIPARLFVRKANMKLRRTAVRIIRGS
ncbi:MAG: S24/S26 family peptidase [Solobacterium sp.]|nr:S24/S26 family peptidase [Solobacterium sp.]